MLHFRSMGAVALLTLSTAMPAFAQMTPESVWSLTQNYLTNAGNQIDVAETKRESDRLVLKTVTVSSLIKSSLEEGAEVLGNTVATIPEIVLRDMGDGKVEITTARDSTVVSTLTQEAGEPLVAKHNITMDQNVTIASGSPEKPRFDYSVVRIELRQDSAGDGVAMPMASDMIAEGLKGAIDLDMASPVHKVDYQATLNKVSVMAKGAAPEETGASASTFDINMTIENLDARYVGTLPQAPEQLSALTGKLTQSSGPMALRLKTEMEPMPLSAALLMKGTKVDLDLSPSQITYSFELSGLDVADADADVAANASASNLTSSGTAQFPSTAEGIDWANATGKVLLGLSGANALLDRVAATGLVGSEEIMSAKMMMAFFTRPGPTPDSIEVEVETTAEGGLLLNGQPMQ